MILQTTKGYPEAVLMGPCEVVLFHKTADWFQDNIGIAFKNKTEHAGGNTWQFEFDGALMLLRYVLTEGIFLCPAALNKATGDDLNAFKKLTEVLVKV